MREAATIEPGLDEPSIPSTGVKLPKRAHEATAVFAFLRLRLEGE
jgi:hypothetical protein